MAAPRITRRAPRTGAPRASANGRNGRVPEYSGPVRLGKRTKRLVKRLEPGDIAIIDHEDIDRVSADDLVACRVRCVINVARSCSSSYPNTGPLTLAEAGVHLVDAPGAPLFDELKDGDEVRVIGGRVLYGDRVVANGEVQDLESVRRMHEQARRQIGEAIETFAANTMDHIREERDLLAGRLELPEFDTRFRDRPALVVVRGVDYQKDLRILRPYVRDVRPVLEIGRAHV